MTSTWASRAGGGLLRLLMVQLSVLSTFPSTSTACGSARASLGFAVPCSARSQGHSELKTFSDFRDPF